MSDKKREDTPEDVLRMRALLGDRTVSSAAESTVSPEMLQAFYDGELEPEQAQEVALALVADPTLAEDLRVTAAIDRERDDALCPQVATAGSRSRWIWTAAAALAAAVLALWFLQPPAPRPSGSDEIRAGGETEPLVSTVAVPSLPRDAFVLTWSGGPTDATYDVQITTTELDAVFDAYDLEEASIRVPAEALSKLESDDELSWRVTAVDGQGRRVHSAAFTVRVR